MNLDLDDTITALSSPPGAAQRGIIRISGASTFEILSRLFEPDNKEKWNSVKRASQHTGVLNLSEPVLEIPVSIMLWKENRSYTGQPMAEIQMIGSPPLLEAVLTTLHRHSVRPARPGEFTLRSFLSGRIDLVQAEAVIGVIDANTQNELKEALTQLAGGLSGNLIEIQQSMIHLLADLEAGLDFVEEDIEFVSQSEFQDRLISCSDVLKDLLQDARNRNISTGQQKVVIAGLPNAGKSSLFNALSQNESAIVTEQAGTTRDYLSTFISCHGIPIELIDTAGWENEEKSIMKIAQHLREEQIKQADLVVWCSATDLLSHEKEMNLKLIEELKKQNQSILYIQTKSDLASGTVPLEFCICKVSTKNKQEMESLLKNISTSLGNEEIIHRQMTGMTASRCQESLEQAINAIDQAVSGSRNFAGDEILAIEVRSALDHLGAILGSVYTDDILDRIFSKFCIGK